RLSGLVAMRLHALIFGAIAGVPLLALAYDPKVTQLMSRLGQEASCIPLAELQSNRAAARMVELMRTPYIGEELQGRSQAMAGLALKNAEQALAIVRAAR